MTNHEDIEVEIKAGDSKAVIAGKTSVSFKTFVMLVLQRKVTTLFKEWGNDAVIVSSELLTGLASAPQDTQENKSQLVLTTMGTGVLAGIFVLAALQLVLLVGLEITLSTRELLIIAGGLLGLAILAAALMKMKRKNKSEKLLETMEKLSGLLSKK
ncbi:MAG: hypothetical protein PHU04_00640 [Candidatus Peribacteraceae bacterium]|nr:hypothetical protein [Candidatus Peribacteraceae bacterium]